MTDLAKAEKMRIAARILNLLADKGWSKSDLAIKTNKHNSEISRWLNGTHNFTIDTLTEIAFVFNITTADLLIDKKTNILAY